MTLKEILKLLQFSYPRQDFTKDNVTAYTMMLKDLDTELLQPAVIQLISSNTFFPSIAEIRGKAADLVLGQEGRPSAIAAYQIAMQGDKLSFINQPDVKRAVVMSCGSTYDMRKSTNPTADRARFIEAYNQILGERRMDVISTPAVKAFIGAGNGKQPARIGGGM